MNNSWIACEVMADMKKVYEDFIFINLYKKCIQKFMRSKLNIKCQSFRVWYNAAMPFWEIDNSWLADENIIFLKQIFGF